MKHSCLKEAQRAMKISIACSCGHLCPLLPWADEADLKVGNYRGRVFSDEKD